MTRENASAAAALDVDDVSLLDDDQLDELAWELGREKDRIRARLLAINDERTSRARAARPTAPGISTTGATARADARGR